MELQSFTGKQGKHIFESDPQFIEVKEKACKIILNCLYSGKLFFFFFLSNVGIILNAQLVYFILFAVK